MAKYETALAEIKNISEQMRGRGLIGFNYRAVDGSIGVAVTPTKCVHCGTPVHVGKSDPDYLSACALVRSWYEDYHDAGKAERAIHETEDGFGARLFAVELKD